RTRRVTRSLEGRVRSGSRPFIRLTFLVLVVRFRSVECLVVCEKGGFMQIQVNTDNNITGREDVVRLVNSSVEGAVGRFSDRITRVEAHLSDTNSHKSKGDDK